jgi:FtsZ-binding cell division protein ZapB
MDTLDIDKLVEDLARQTKELPRDAIEGALADMARQSIERALEDMVGPGFKSLKSHNRALKKANTALSQENERLSQENEQLARELRGRFWQDSMGRGGFIPVKDTLRPGHRTWHYIQ